MKIDVILMPQFFPGCRLHSFLQWTSLTHVWFLILPTTIAMKMLERKGKRVQVIKPNHDVISAHTVRLRRGRKYRNKM